jgi:hypothetical protein
MERVDEEAVGDEADPEPEERHRRDSECRPPANDVSEREDESGEQKQNNEHEPENAFLTERAKKGGVSGDPDDINILARPDPEHVRAR